jgi:tetratricopeptide (TPR) repeat protein
MARAIDINAQYAEVTEVDSFNKVGDTVVYNSHVCAVVFDGPKPYLIDFSLRRYPQYRAWRAISDLEAVASFYNNIGSEKYLNEDDPARFENAMRYYNMSLKLYPDAPQVYNNIGVLELNRGNVAAAERNFRKALEIRPGYFAAYNNLGSIYNRRGETNKSIELLGSAIKASPDNPFAYLSLARLQVSEDLLEEAEMNLKKALSVDKRFTEARHELGRLYLRMGRGSEALRQFALALKYQPDDDIARNKMELIQQLALDK